MNKTKAPCAQVLTSPDLCIIMRKFLDEKGGHGRSNTSLFKEADRVIGSEKLGDKMDTNKKSGLVIPGLLTQTHEEKLAANETEVPEGATEVGVLTPELIDLFTTGKVEFEKAKELHDYIKNNPDADDLEEKKEALKDKIALLKVLEYVRSYEVRAKFGLSQDCNVGIGKDFKVWYENVPECYCIGCEVGMLLTNAMRED